MINRADVDYIFKALLGRLPESDSVYQYHMDFESRVDLVKQIASTDEFLHRSFLDGVDNKLNVAAQSLFIDNSKYDEASNGAYLYSGYSSSDFNGYFLEPKATILCKGYVDFFIRAVDFKITPVQTVIVRSCELEYMFELDDNYYYFRFRHYFSSPQYVNFEMVSNFRPSDIYPDSVDDRLLSVHIQSFPDKNWTEWQSCPKKFLEKATYFLYTEKKERESLFPVFRLAKNCAKNVFLLDQYQFGNEYSLMDVGIRCFVVSSSNAFNYFKRRYGGRYIYIDHGLSPIKSYSYGAHFRNYDQVILPGEFLMRRIENLYPDLKGRLYSSGYPKLRSRRIISVEERAIFCEKWGLDARLPIVIFMPTWSGGAKDAGVNLCMEFPSDSNMICVPHGADYSMVDASLKLRYRIAIDHEKDASYYYDFADVVVSEISSCLIEAAVLGVAVVAIKLTNYVGVDRKFIKIDGGVEIPYSNLLWHDLFHSVGLHEIEYLLSKINSAGVDWLKERVCSDMLPLFVGDIGDSAAESVCRVIFSRLENR